MTDQHKEVLRKHYKLFILVHDHQYLPSGYHSEVGELNQVYKDTRGVYKDTSCNTCVGELFHELYIPFEKESGSSLFDGMDKQTELRI